MKRENAERERERTDRSPSPVTTPTSGDPWQKLVLSFKGLSNSDQPFQSPTLRLCILRLFGFHLTPIWGKKYPKGKRLKDCKIDDLETRFQQIKEKAKYRYWIWLDIRNGRSRRSCGVLFEGIKAQSNAIRGGRRRLMMWFSPCSPYVGFRVGMSEFGMCVSPFLDFSMISLISSLKFLYAVNKTQFMALVSFMFSCFCKTIFISNLMTFIQNAIRFSLSRAFKYDIKGVTRIYLKD